MKRLMKLMATSLVLAMILSSTAFASVTSKVGSSRGVKLSSTSIVLLVGKTQELKATLTGGVKASSSPFSSSNTTVATVSAKGVVTGKRPGTAIITCTATYGRTQKYTAQTKVTVTDGTMTISASSVNLIYGRSMNLSVKDRWTCFSLTEGLTWTSSNTNVVTVGQKNGRITATGMGSATVTCRNLYGKSISCRVTVNKLDTSYMKHSMSQYSTTYDIYENDQKINYFAKPWPWNAGCCAVAHAIGVSIITKKDIDPTVYWDRNVGTTHYDTAHTNGAEITFSPSTILSRLNHGLPVMIHSGNHYTIVIGLTATAASANKTSLTAEDFLIIDPVWGNEGPLNDANGYDKDHIKMVLMW